MRAIRFYIILLLLSLGVSCKKKTYPVSVEENGAVFYFKGDIDGSPVYFSAGTDNYYMYSSFLQDVNGVYNFSGDLTKAGCSNCASGLQVRINDFKISARGANAVIDSSLKPGRYPIIAGDKSAYSVQFTSAYIKQAAASYLWNFGDGSTSTAASPAHTYLKPGNYKVCLSVNGVNGCVADICSEQKIGSGAGFGRASISAKTTGVSSLQFNSGISNFSAVSYQWDFGDNSAPSYDPNPLHNYAHQGAYPVTLRVHDATGNMVIAHYNAITANDLSSCAVNYSVSSVSTLTNSPGYLNLKAVEITWKDANGVVYSSNNELQPAANYFEILSVEDYDVNEKQQKTRKIHVRFSMTVYNGTKAITIENAEAVVAVAYQ